MKVPKILTICLIALSLSLFTGLSAYAGWDQTQLTDDSDHDRNSSLDNGQIAYRSGSSDVNFWDGTSTQTITTVASGYPFPSLKNGTIAWRYGSTYIQYWDGSSIQTVPDQFGSDMVGHPSNGGEFIGWTTESEMQGNKVLIWSRAGSPTEYVSEGANDDISVDGMDFAYEKEGAIRYLGVSDIEVSAWGKENPVLDNGGIAYRGLYDSTLYYWDGSTEHQVYTGGDTWDYDVSDGNVAYIGADGKVYYWDGTYTYKISDTTGNIQISTDGDMIAWSHHDGNDYEIMYAQLTAGRDLQVSGGDWDYDPNWGAPEPTSSDDVSIGGGRTVTVSQDGEVAQSITLSNGTLNITGGDLTLSGDAVTGLSGTDTINQSGTAGGLYMNSGQLVLGYGTGSCTYNMSGGTLEVKTLTFGSGTGTLNLTGGFGAYVEGFGLNGTGTGTINIDGANLLKGAWPTLDVDNLNIGNASGKTGSYAMTSSKTITAANENIGGYGTGTFTQNGGTHTVTGTVSIGAETGSSGTYDLNSGSFDASAVSFGAGSATLNLDGGLATIDSFSNGSGASTINMNGGSLAGNWTDLNVDTLRVGVSASAAFETGANKTLNVTNMVVGYNGTVAQNGGTHNIADTLSVVNSYSLDSGTLDADTIDLNGGMGSFSFTGGTLKVDAFEGDLTVGEGGTLSPGNSPGITTVYGNFVSSGTLEIEIGGTTAGTEFDQINVIGGDVTLGGTVNVSWWDSYEAAVGDKFSILTWQDGYTFTDNGFGITGIDGFLMEEGDSLQFVYSDSSMDGIKDMVDTFDLAIDIEDLNALYDLYVNAEEGVYVEIDGEDWTYYSGLLPGDDGSRAIGESWEYNGGYFIKLGSGVGTAVPELPPLSGQGLLLGFGGIGAWVKARRRGRGA